MKQEQVEFWTLIVDILIQKIIDIVIQIKNAVRLTGSQTILDLFFFFFFFFSCCWYNLVKLTAFPMIPASEK